MPELSDVISFIATFLIVWWIVFFIALPIGIEAEGKVELGNDVGAPKNPRLKVKVIGTSIVTLILTYIIFRVYIV